MQEQSKDATKIKKDWLYKDIEAAMNNEFEEELEEK